MVTAWTLDSAVVSRELTPAEVADLDALRFALASTVDRTEPRALAWLWDRLISEHGGRPAPAGFVEAIATALGDLLAVHVPRVRWSVWPGPDGPTLGVVSEARPTSPVVPFLDAQDRWASSARDWVVDYLTRAAAHLAGATVPRQHTAPESVPAADERGALGRAFDSSAVPAAAYDEPAAAMPTFAPAYDEPAAPMPTFTPSYDEPAASMPTFAPAYEAGPVPPFDEMAASALALDALQAAVPAVPAFPAVPAGPVGPVDPASGEPWAVQPAPVGLVDVVVRPEPMPAVEHLGVSAPAWAPAPPPVPALAPEPVAPDGALEDFALSTLDHAVAVLRETGAFDREAFVVLQDGTGQRLESCPGDPRESLQRAREIVGASGARRAAVAWIDRLPLGLPGPQQRFPAVLVDAWQAGGEVGVRVARRFVDDVLGTDLIGAPVVVGPTVALL